MPGPVLEECSRTVLKILWVPPGQPPLPKDEAEAFGHRLQQMAGADAERHPLATYHNKRLCEPLGFRAGEPFAPDGGPPLWPMWRGLGLLHA